MRVSTETSHFYVDLVFYNFLLKCFVIADLKTEKLTHQDIGQMDMYVRMFDELKRNPDDNPTEKELTSFIERENRRLEDTECILFMMKIVYLKPLQFLVLKLIEKQ